MIDSSSFNVIFSPSSRISRSISLSLRASFLACEPYKISFCCRSHATYNLSYLFRFINFPFIIINATGKDNNSGADCSVKNRLFPPAHKERFVSLIRQQATAAASENESFILKGRAAMPKGAFDNTEKSFCGAGTRPFYSTGKASGFMLPDREPLLPLHHHRHLRWE